MNGNLRSGSGGHAGAGCVSGSGSAGRRAGGSRAQPSAATPARPPARLPHPPTRPPVRPSARPPRPPRTPIRSTHTHTHAATQHAATQHAATPGAREAGGEMQEEGERCALGPEGCVWWQTCVPEPKPNNPYSSGTRGGRISIYDHRHAVVGIPRASFRFSYRPASRASPPATGGGEGPSASRALGGPAPVRL